LAIGALVEIEVIAAAARSRVAEGLEHNSEYDIVIEAV